MGFGIIFSLISILGFSRLLYIKKAVPKNCTFVVAVCSIVFSLYFAVLVGWLSSVTYFLLFTGLVCFCGFLIYDFKKDKASKFWLSPEVVIFFVGCALLYWYFHAAAIHTWDDFSHWGLISKDIVLNQALPGASSPVAAKSYPPAVALMNAFFLVPLGFSEPGLFFSQSFIILTALLGVLHPIKKMTFVEAIVFSFGIFGLVSFFYRWDWLYVDHHVGIFFGVSLVWIFLGKERSGLITLSSFPLGFLALLKPIAMAFSLGAIVLGGCVFSLNFFLKKDATSKSNLVALCIPLLCCLFLYSSWGWYLDEVGFSNSNKVLFSLSDIQATLLGELTQRESLTFEAFFSFFVENSLIYLIAYWLFFSFFIFLANKRSLLFNRSQFFLASIGLSLGYLAYHLLLLGLYLYSFSEYEGIRLASIHRYVGSYELGAVIFVLVYIVHILSENTSKYLAELKVMIGVVFLGIFIESGFPRNILSPASSFSEQRLLIRNLTQDLIVDSPKDSQVYIIWQESKGYAYQVTGYEIHPRRVNAWCWTLGEKFMESDPWTCDLDLGEFKDRLKDYDYLLIGALNKSFIDRYKDIFGESSENKDKSDLLGSYKINLENGEVHLKKL